MPNSYTSVRTRQIGATLKQSRRVSGMVGEFVAGKLGVSISKISRLESGQRPPKLADVAGLLAPYGVTGKAREELLKLCNEAEAGETGWWQRREMWGKYDCVELSFGADVVAVRDSKDPEGARLAFTPAAFGRFLAATKQDHLSSRP